MRRSTSILCVPAWLVVTLSLAACPGDDGTGETGAGDSTGTDGGSTAAASSTSAATTDMPQTTTGPATTSSEGGDTTAGGDDTTAVCTATCEHLVECEVESVPTCAIPCTGIGDTVAGCEAEYVAQQQCVLALSCEDAQAWSDAGGLGDGYPCAAEDDAYQLCIAG